MDQKQQLRKIVPAKPTSAKKPVAPVKVIPSTVDSPATAPVLKTIPDVKDVAVNSAPLHTLDDDKAILNKGPILMNDTISKVSEATKNFTADASAKAHGLYGDALDKSKSAMEKTTKMAEELASFQKENLEAVAASAKVMTDGVQSAAQRASEMGRKTFEDVSATMKAFAAVKTPSEFLSLQSEYIKSSYEAMVAESSKASEAALKLMGEIVQPLSSRYAIAAEKLKAASKS